MVCSPWSRKESGTNERLTLVTSLIQLQSHFFHPCCLDLVNRQDLQPDYYCGYLCGVSRALLTIFSILEFFLCLHWSFLTDFCWRIVALQSCVSAWCTAEGTSGTCTFMPPFFHFLPLEVSTRCWVEFPVLFCRFPSVPYFILSTKSVCMPIPISQFVLPSLSPGGIHTLALCTFPGLVLLPPRSLGPLCRFSMLLFSCPSPLSPYRELGLFLLLFSCPSPLSLQGVRTVFQDLIVSALYFSPYICPFHSKFWIHVSGQLPILDFRDIFIPGPVNMFNVFSSLVISVYLVNVFNAPAMCKRLY